jgi:hypothetical protein
MIKKNTELELNGRSVAHKAVVNKLELQHKMIDKGEHENRMEDKWFSTLNTKLAPGLAES